MLYRPSDEPKDTVIGQSSPPDVQIKRETVINLTVSLGPEEKDEKESVGKVARRWPFSMGLVAYDPKKEGNR